MPVCQQCGYLLEEDHNACPECNAPEKATSLFWLTLFFGWAGLHHLLTGRPYRALLYFLGSTFGVVLLFPPLLVGGLAVRDLIRIARGTFTHGNRNRRYGGKRWMSVTLLIILLGLPFLFGVAIVSGLWWVRNSDSNPERVQDIERVVQGYVELTKAYQKEYGRVGSWDEMHFDPGILRMAGFQLNFNAVNYEELNPGIRIENTHDLKGCPAGNTWDLTLTTAQNLEDGSYVIQYSLQVPELQVCRDLFPGFYRLNHGRVRILESKNH